MNIWMLSPYAIAPDLLGRAVEKLALSKELVTRRHDVAFFISPLYHLGLVLQRK